MKEPVNTLGYILFTIHEFIICTLIMVPFWGWLIHRYTVYRSHVILCASCVLWGAATLSISASNTVFSQAIFRAINGAALASIMPLSQMMLTELVASSDHHGKAFGLMGFLEKAAATISTSAVIWLDDWRGPYRVIGYLSIFMAFVSRKHLKIMHHNGRSSKKKEDDVGVDDEEHQQEGWQGDGRGEEKLMSFLQIFRRISQIPVFIYLVAQGLFGAIPWDMMSFILLLLEWKDFTRQPS